MSRDQLGINFGPSTRLTRRGNRTESSPIESTPHAANSADHSLVDVDSATLTSERPVSSNDQRFQDFENLQVDEALAQLIDMGFEDENINRFMLIKNGLDISGTVNDLIAERCAEASIVREQPRSSNNVPVPSQSMNSGTGQSNSNPSSSSFLCDFD